MKVHVLQNNHSKGWQGYVGIPKGHPLYKKDYTSFIENPINPELVQSSEQLMENKGIIPTFLNMISDNNWNNVASLFDIHGGITFSGFNYWDHDKLEIIHNELTLKYQKLQKLLSKCGNELFSHWYNLGARISDYSDNSNTPFYNQAVKAHNIYTFLKAYNPIIKENLIITTKELKRIENFGFNEKWYGNEDNLWYFGFDAAHMGDDEYSCSKDWAKEEAKKLKEQLLTWTENYYKI